MSQPSVLFDLDDGIATITLNRPDARNALSAEVTDALDDALAQAEDGIGDTVHAVILTGAGGTFCAGGDIKAMRERRGETPMESRARLHRAHHMLKRLVGLSVPVIAAVDGAAAGAGSNLALACDFVLASNRARFMQSFCRIGLIPDYGGLFQLPRIVGMQKAKELMFTGRTVDVGEARSLGMVYSVHPADGLMDAARAFAHKFREASSDAIGMTKYLMLRSFDTDLATMLEFEAQGQSVVRKGEYHQDCIDRFLDKRPLKFDWERMKSEESA